MWHANIITYNPEFYPGLWQTALIGKALQNKIWDYTIYDIKHFANQLGCRIDDTPYGGGAGMVMRPDVGALALDNLKKNDKRNSVLVYPSASGKTFDADMAKSWAKESSVSFLCGRFEGIDHRIIEIYNLQEVSLGDFILCGGDSAVQVMVEATLRYVDGVLGNFESATYESFEGCLLEHEHYTRPASWRGMDVPKILSSGDHSKINNWRLQRSIDRTKEKRPDLWKKYCLMHQDNK